MSTSRARDIEALRAPMATLDDVVAELRALHHTVRQLLETSAARPTKALNRTDRERLARAVARGWRHVRPGTSQ